MSANYTTRLNTVFDSVCAVLNIKRASAAVMVTDGGIWTRAYGQSHAGVPININMTFKAIVDCLEKSIWPINKVSFFKAGFIALLFKAD